MQLSTFRNLVLASLLLLAPLQPAAAAGTGVDPTLRRLLIAAINDSSSFHDRFDAEVWLSDMSSRLDRYMPDPASRLEFLRLVHAEATRADVPPELVLAVIDVESHFNRWAVSGSGALGLMQIMPFWLTEIGRPDDNLMNAATNLRLGCTILKYYIDMESGNLRKALARYNGSLGNRRYPDKVFDLLSTRWYQQ